MTRRFVLAVLAALPLTACGPEADLSSAALPSATARVDDDCTFRVNDGGFTACTFNGSWYTLDLRDDFDRPRTVYFVQPIGRGWDHFYTFQLEGDGDGTPDMIVIGFYDAAGAPRSMEFAIDVWQEP